MNTTAFYETKQKGILEYDPFRYEPATAMPPLQWDENAADSIDSGIRAHIQSNVHDATAFNQGVEYGSHELHPLFKGIMDSYRRLA